MSRSKLILMLLVISLVLPVVTGCDDDDDDDTTLTQDDDDNDDADDDDDNDSLDDDDDDDTTGELPEWLFSRPHLTDFSLWNQTIDMNDPVWPRELGIIGVGNGRVYGNLANHYPLATWHNMGGPTYQKDLKWFSNIEPRLFIGGEIQQPDVQSTKRVRTTPITVITAANSSIEWTSVNFAAKWPEDILAEQALISVWIVRNLGSETLHGIVLNLDSRLGRFKNGMLEENAFDGKKLAARPLDYPVSEGAQRSHMPVHLGSLKPGNEKVVVIPFAMFAYNQDPEDIFAAIEQAGVDPLLESTVDWWKDWASDIAKINTPDQKFNDLIMAQAVAIKINQAISGGASEMNQYSHCWLRDTYGPALFYPMIGLLDDYIDMLDYIWGATLVRGGIANAYNLDHDLSNLPPQPDWDSMGIMGGRQKAEGPSLLVLQHEEYYEATNDLATIQERWGMLKHALQKQVFVDGCLLHFSSDETFEDVMEVAFGENFFNEPDESTLSLYSSLLMIRAADFMARMAAELGYAADEAIFETLRDDVTDCLENTYWIDSQGTYAVKVATDTREQHLQPYEDVNTMPIWTGALSLDNPRVVSNFEEMMDMLSHSDGTLYTPLAEPFASIFGHVEKGVLTGMSHGYWLFNLSRMFHPTADKAFALWDTVFSETGFTDEAVIVDDFGHMQLLREPFGIVSDISSRFRSWESGVMGYAFLHHLTGYEVSVPDGWVELAPHLPQGWDEFSIEGLGFGDKRFDLAVYDLSDNGKEIVITTGNGAAFDLHLTVPLDADVLHVYVNDQELPFDEFTFATNDYGRGVVKLEPIALTANGQWTIRIPSVD